jgi:IS4 transposase
VEYRDPETQKLHRFVTTLPESINPGTIAMLYYKRWTIEKAFNNSKSNFKKTKAWSSNDCSLKNQMRLTAMSYN